MDLVQSIYLCIIFYHLVAFFVGMQYSYIDINQLECTHEKGMNGAKEWHNISVIENNN